MVSMIDFNHWHLNEYQTKYQRIGYFTHGLKYTRLYTSFTLIFNSLFIHPVFVFLFGHILSHSSKAYKMAKHIDTLIRFSFVCIKMSDLFNFDSISWLFVANCGDWEINNKTHYRLLSLLHATWINVFS